MHEVFCYSYKYTRELCSVPLIFLRCTVCTVWTNTAELLDRVIFDASVHIVSILCILLVFFRVGFWRVFLGLHTKGPLSTLY